jgi:hypothetical protein
MARSSNKLGALGFTFACMRVMQAISLISVIGLSSNFIGGIISGNGSTPQYLIGTLVVTCISTIYVAISSILYYDGQLSFILAAAADGIILIALIVVASVVGKPISYLDCEAILASDTASVASFFATVSYIRPNQESLWTAGDRASCFQVKAVWGLAIALCVLFAFSAIVMLCLWRRLRTLTSSSAPKDIEG